MRRALALIGALACSPVSLASEPTPLFTTNDFAHLTFLDGRWEGTGPDGKPFYEQYAFPDASHMRSTRFADAAFTQAQDGSVVALDAGRVTSTWGEFTWEASELSAGRACFIPVNAPSSFCWERVSDSEVTVTQRWTDEAGTPQSYAIPLRRL